jgi:lysozyme
VSAAISEAFARLQTEEGFRAMLYTDTTGHATIGYGFNVSAGISQRAAAALLLEQITEADEALQQEYPWYGQISPARASVLIDMAINEGLSGLINGFPKMLAAAASGDWVTASAQCAVENPKLDASRYAPLRALLLSG